MRSSRGKPLKFNHLCNNEEAEKETEEELPVMWEHIKNWWQCVQEEELKSSVKLCWGLMRWGWNWPPGSQCWDHWWPWWVSFLPKRIRRIEKSIDSSFKKFCSEWGPRKRAIDEEGYEVKTIFLKISFIEVWLTYNTTHQLRVYRSMSFDKCVHQCECHHNPDAEQFHHLRNLLGASSHQSASHPQTQEATDLFSVTINEICLF